MTTTDVDAAVAEIKKLVGMESAQATHQIERGHMRRFVEAIGDPNPIWADEVAARGTRYGDIVAPPTFLRACPPGPFAQPIRSPLTRILDGGSDWEYFEPVRPGDAITAVQRFAEVTTRQSRLGTLVIMTQEIRYTNQLGQFVATQRNHGISY